MSLAININANPLVPNDIRAYAHCRRCVDEKLLPNIAAGITNDEKLQVWCENHQINIAVFDIAIVEAEP